MNDLESYRLSTPLVQAITNTLNDLPARVSRLMLNAMEVECVQQDQAHAAAVGAARAQADEAAKTAEVEAAVAARLQEMRATEVQPPALRAAMRRRAAPK